MAGWCICVLFPDIFSRTMNVPKVRGKLRRRRRKCNLIAKRITGVQSNLPFQETGGLAVLGDPVSKTRSSAPATVSHVDTSRHEEKYLTLSRSDICACVISSPEPGSS